MRTLIALLLVTSLAACASKKKAVSNPSNTGGAGAGSANETEDREEKDSAKPDDPDDAMKSSDPCEGGE